jgi:hypothetical protein
MGKGAAFDWHILWKMWMNQSSEINDPKQVREMRKVS